MRSGSGDDGHDRGDDRGLDFASKEPQSGPDHGRPMKIVAVR